MNNIDYSKPVGWWCSHCAKTRRLAFDVPASTHVTCGGIHDTTVMIPVFAEIPKGERPETNEPDDDDICVGTHAGLPFVGRGIKEIEDLNGRVRGVSWLWGTVTAYDVLWVANSRFGDKFEPPEQSTP